MLLVHLSRNFVGVLAASAALCFGSSILAQVNDNCSGAIAVIDGMNGPFDNTLATTSMPPWACALGGNDLWFSYMATCNGNASVETCGANFDTAIEAFSGTCAGLVPIGCNDDACGLQSRITFAVTVGTTYLLRVGGFNGATGQFPVTVACVPTLTNDECTGAIPVINGMNGPFTNIGATTSVPAWPCATGGADVWFVYTATCDGDATAATCGGDYDSAIEAFSGGCGALVSLGCNDDLCSLQSSVTFPVTMGQTYHIRVGGFSSSTGNFPLEVSCDFPFGIEGISEATPGAGTLGPLGGAFMTGYDLRWNYVDSQGLAAGKFAATVINLGPGCTPPIGVTAAIPGFVQVWAGSAPPGLALVGPIGLIPIPDQVATIPAGIFNPGDKIRMQAVLLDAVNAPGSLPVIPSLNTIQFVNAAAVVAGAEDFETVPTGIGNYAAGWSNGGGVHEWRVDSGGTPSGGTGPSAAFTGVNYMYCETSSPVVQGETFIMNTAVVPSAGVTAVSFALSRVGDSIGDLEVRLGDGSGTFPTLLCSYSGASPAEWTEEVIALGSGLPANIQIQFLYAAGPSFRGDIAIDTFGYQ